MPAPFRVTPARGVVLALGLPVAAVLFGLTAFTAVAMADQVGFRVHLTVPVGGRHTRVSIDNADAVVRPGPGQRIRMSGSLHGSLARPAFRWRSSAAGLSLNAQCWSWTGFCSLGYTITAPATLPLTVSDGTGNLNASGFGGHITLSDATGDLRASRLAGALSLTDGSGDITASRLSGGDVRLSDGTGNITVTGLAGTRVTGDDGSGNITLTFAKVPRQVNITDSTGDITLVLPRGPTAYQVDAHSSSGTTNVSVRQVKTGQFSRYVINASDGSGNVTIR